MPQSFQQSRRGLVVSFNSLFEMPRRGGALHPDRADAMLSILYLRCIANQTLLTFAYYDTTFNSLFEMRGWLQIRARRYALVAFNSLFEMRRRLRPQPCHGEDVPFNSLFEMPTCLTLLRRQPRELSFQFSI